jgi:hypothetical protein
MADYVPTYPPNTGSLASGRWQPATPGTPSAPSHRFAKPLRIFASGFFHARSQGGLPWVNATQPSA